MCYSAQILADYRRFVKMFGAVISVREFAQLAVSMNMLRMQRNATEVSMCRYP
ncbi:hypothetical protein OKW35_000914 [Paraburkholderia sp. MM5477-R1]